MCSATSFVCSCCGSCRLNALAVCLLLQEPGGLHKPSVHNNVLMTMVCTWLTVTAASGTRSKSTSSTVEEKTFVCTKAYCWKEVRVVKELLLILATTLSFG